MVAAKRACKHGQGCVNRRGFGYNKAPRRSDPVCFLIRFVGVADIRSQQFFFVLRHKAEPRHPTGKWPHRFSLETHGVGEEYAVFLPKRGFIP